MSACWEGELRKAEVEQMPERPLQPPEPCCAPASLAGLTFTDDSLVHWGLHTAAVSWSQVRNGGGQVTVYEMIRILIVHVLMGIICKLVVVEDADKEGRKGSRTQR